MIGALPLAAIIEDEAPRACRVPSCPRPHSAHGYCDLHLKRLLRQGDTSAPTREGALGRLVARALDLADVDADDDAAWEASVGELERASDFLQAVKGRGGARPEKAAARETRMQKVTRIRGAVFERAAGVCEFCRRRQPREWFHVIGGPLRRKLESEGTTAAACWECHRAWERNDRDVMRAVKEWALRHGFREAVRAVERRIAKVEEARR